MTYQEEIVEAYREADAAKRLHLFLDCPSLRNEFMQIDLSGTPQANMKEHRERASVRSFTARWRLALGNCCLKLRGS